MKPLKLVATCARGLESLLADELVDLMAQDIDAGDRVVHFSASPEIVYRVLLGTRLANRVLLPVCEVPAKTSNDLYRELCAVDWSAYLNPDVSFCVDFIGESDTFRNSMFGAQRVKDALVDSTRDGSRRATVAKDNPDIRFNAVLLNDSGRTNSRMNSEYVQVAVDLGNGSLHKRGYRQEAGEAPLKETLAAAMLIRANWPAIAKQGGALFDPFCGSGTFLIEAALMAAHIAPGTYRQQWGVAQCPWHDETLWHSLRKEAHHKLLNIGCAGLPKIIGSDVLTTVIKKARTNIEHSSLSEHIFVEAEHASDSTPPRAKTGLLICNPPYGERLDDDPDLIGLYAKLGEKMGVMHGWSGAVLTSDKTYAQAIGLRSHKSYRFDNGAIPCRLYLFDLNDKNYFKPVLAVQKETIVLQNALSESAQMLYNRLHKNQQKLASWLARSQVTCYRLYDADLPEYAFAIDIYQNSDNGEIFVHLQEYAPPKTINEQAARRRREETQLAVSAALNLPLRRVVMKSRERQRGDNQYQKNQNSKTKKINSTQKYYENTLFPVLENGKTFWIDLHTYLDTGLFLDTRPARSLLAELTSGKHFLNLFCYTASASVYAAKAGAISSLSIDMSSTYIEWARSNFVSNKIDTRQHKLLTADCLQWLNETTEKFDVIYLDPPTFSNSKKMQYTLDIQRDQVELISAALDLLNDDGTLVFVTNYQRFKLEQEVFCENGWHVKNLTAQTIDRDFQRSHKIHQCWVFSR